MKTIEDWSEITIGQYQEMMSIQTDRPITKFIEMIAIALDCDPQEIRELPISEYKVLQEKMSFISKEPQSDIKYTFELNNKKYGLIPDMNLMKAGVFLDAEQFKLDPMANLHYTIALIYRPIISEEEDGTYLIAEHKAEGFETRAELFRDNLSIEIVLGAVLFFFSARDGIINRFSNLFGGGFEDQGEPDDYDDDPNSYEEARANAFNKRWGLYHMIVKLADGDLVRVQELFELPIMAIFNHISYLTSGGYKKTI